jgi:pyruvate dehydrogenase E2 component (dihydrolipoamide acetyltransferase)
MAHVVVMPRQGNSVESCILGEWAKREGDVVRADETLCAVETDKAVFEVPAGFDGTVLKLLRSSGEEVPVMEPIAVIGAGGEDWRAALGEAAKALAESPKAAPAASIAAPPAVGSGRPSPRTNPQPDSPGSLAAAGVSPRARALAAHEAIDAAGLQGSGPEGRVIERDVRAAIEARPPLTASAKAALRGGGFAVPVSGSGIGLRVRLEDLEKAPSGGTEGPAGQAPGPYTDAPFKGIRKLIAERMGASLSSSAQYTMTMSADATRLLAMRARLKASPPETGLSGVTVNDLVMFALARTLSAFPYMNAHKLRGFIRSFARVSLGMAVDTPRGLLVPVIAGADGLGLKELSAESKRLAAACLAGSVKAEELSGSTFTISNLGALGVDSFTPILNSPEVGILGLCRTRTEAAPMPDGSIGFVQRIGLSLTIDHEAVDGAPAARFLKALCEAIEAIDLMVAF